MRFVALKSEEQQAVLSLHRIRAQWVKMRTMQAHQVRGLLYEFGLVVPKGWRALLAQAAPLLSAQAPPAVPELLRGELQRQLEGLRALTARIVELRCGSEPGSAASTSVGALPRCPASDG